MLRKGGIIFLGCLMLLSTVALAMSHEGGEVKETTGVIFQVVKAKQIIDVEEGEMGLVSQYKITSETKLTKEGQSISFSDLKAGDAVDITYTTPPDSPHVALVVSVR